MQKLPIDRLVLHLQAIKALKAAESDVVIPNDIQQIKSIIVKYSTFFLFPSD